jgi:hypothetical protein
MKKYLAVLVLLCAIFQGLTAQSSNLEKVVLFNGKDLNNWIFYLKDPAVDPSNVFTIKDGVIHITGSPFGYMRTREAYTGYTLNLQWRWPAEATNSGVFIHAQQPDTIWPLCFECQLRAGSAGDFVCMAGADMTERTDKTKIVVAKKTDSNEKPAGEWNTLRIVCRDNTIEIYINGTLQNKATGTNIAGGSICLQSEGKAIEFRDVYLTMTD